MRDKKQALSKLHELHSQVMNLSDEMSDAWKETLDLIYRKGVAVGFILMMEEGHMGGAQEYNDFIGAKKLYLTEEEYTAIAEYGKKVCLL